MQGTPAAPANVTGDQDPAAKARALWRAWRLTHSAEDLSVAGGAKRLHERERLVKDLAALGDAAIDLARGILSDPKSEAHERSGALEILAGIREPRSLELLVAEIRAPHDPSLRLRAAELLHGRDDPAVSEALRETLSGEPAFPGRYALVRALASTGRPEAGQALAGVLRQDGDLESRSHAAEGLARYAADPAVRAALIESAAGDVSPHVRLNAWRSLAGVADADVIALAAARMPKETDAGIRAVLRKIRGLPEPR